MKYGLIGCGRIAVNHIKAVQENKLDLCCMCDLNEENIDSLLKKTSYEGQVKKYTDYKKMIDDNAYLELVSIATSSDAHSEIALYALSKGINVIVEKPMAMSMKEADKMIKQAEENHVKLCVCHQNRFNVAIQRLRSAIETDKLGKLSHGSIEVRWNRDKSYYDQAPWRGKWFSDGGALMNQCIHGIDLLRWMLGGKVIEVYGVIAQRFHDYLECEDIGTAILKFDNGSIGTIEGTVNVYPENLEENLYIFGENGTVKVSGKSCNEVAFWNIKGDENPELIKEETKNVYGNGHIKIFEDMISAIINDRNPYVDGYAGKDALEIVLAIYKSQLLHKPITLPLNDFDSIQMEGLFD